MICFVILHYQNTGDTKEAISSIVSNAGANDYKIIVVDNASPNHSGNELKNFYSNNRNVIVIINKENLGFAKGNNIGFRIAKMEYNADFIVMMNNDVNIISKNFSKLIKDIFEREHYAVLGPLIINGKGYCGSNPVSYSERTVDEIRRDIAHYRRNIFFIKNHIKWIQDMLTIRNGKKTNNINGICLGIRKNVKLHGCFWIFSQIYIEKFDGINDQTFMYMEEDFLQHRINQAQMLMMYSPEIVIYHKEGASTKKICSAEREIRKYSWLIESCELFADVLENGDKYD